MLARLVSGVWRLRGFRRSALIEQVPGEFTSGGLDGSDVLRVGVQAASIARRQTPPG
jgi:hypothetical protein